MTASLRLACIDADAPPLFGLARAPGGRAGYEPAVGELIAAELGRRLEWVIMAWGDMLPAAQKHEVDAVLCGQGIIPARLEQVDFTRPYGIFHEGILMRRGEAVPDPWVWPASGLPPSGHRRTTTWPRLSTVRR